MFNSRQLLTLWILQRASLSLLHLYFLLSRLNTPPVVFSWNHVGFYSACLWETIFFLECKTSSVTWWLQINEDLEGEVRFASAVGPFAVPLRCTIKKCDVSEFLQAHWKVMAMTSKLLLIWKMRLSFLHKYVCGCDMGFPQSSSTGCLSWSSSLTLLASICLKPPAVNRC